MPVRYDIAAQIPQASGGGIDPLNMMAAMRQQEYQNAQLAALQQRGAQEALAAQYAANRDMRAAEAASRQAELFGAQKDEIQQKLQAEKINVYRNMFDKFVNDQASLDHFVGMMEKDFPQGVAAFKGKKYSDDWKLSLLDPAKAAELAKPQLSYDKDTGTVIDLKSGTARPITMGAAAAAGAATPAPPATGFNMDAAKAGIAKVESGGKYDVLGPATKSGDRAYGKYQVMGANIPAWTKQALGQAMTPEQFLNSPQAQEAVFEDQFRRNVAKYGTVQDAASVWFSGRPMAKAGNARDVLGTTVPDYVNKFMAGYQGGVKNAMVQPMTGEAPSLRNVPVDAFAAPAMPPAPMMPMVPQPARPQTLMEYAAKTVPAKPPSKEQSDSYGFATRIVRDMPILQDQTKIDAGSSAWNRAVSNVPFGYGNQWAGKDYQQITQAQRDFINAVLRRESGAAISPQEFENAALQYFPQPGDDPETVKQKLANQRTQLEAIMYGMVPDDRQRLQGELDAQKTKLPKGVRSIEEVR